MQPAGSSQRRFRGSLDFLRHIYTTEGLAGLQRGLSFAMLREASKNSFRIGLYDPLLDWLHPPHPECSAVAPWSSRLTAGLISGAIAALVCNPLDLLKVRLQLDESHPRGAGADGSARRLLARIVAVEGARGLWIGTPANMLRSMVTSASQLGVNSRLKEAAKGSSLVPGIFSDACCALGAGVATVVAMNPIDVVRTRLYAQPVGESGVGAYYTGPAHCIWRIGRVEGVLAFYKGTRKQRPKHKASLAQVSHNDAQAIVSELNSPDWRVFSHVSPMCHIYATCRLQASSPTF